MLHLNMQQKMFVTSAFCALVLVFGIVTASSVLPDKFTQRSSFSGAAEQKSPINKVAEAEKARIERLNKPLEYEKGRRYVALTFDDGPSRYTKDVLKILRDNEVRATFFVIGKQIKQGKTSIIAAHGQGCQIASHTYRHRYFPNKSRALFVKDVRKTRRILRQQTGIDSAYVRLPYGATNKKMNKALKKMNIRKVFWTIDTRDWSRPGVDKIVHLATKNVRNGSIILMHDGGGNREQTLKALPQVIRILKDKGYEFCTVDDLYRFGIK